MASKNANGAPVLIGRNVEAMVNGKELTLRVKLDAPTWPSKSGKNELLASTQGNVTLAGGETIGLNIYRAS